MRGFSSIFLNSAKVRNGPVSVAGEGKGDSIGRAEVIVGVVDDVGTANADGVDDEDDVVRTEEASACPPGDVTAISGTVLFISNQSAVMLAIL